MSRIIHSQTSICIVLSFIIFFLSSYFYYILLYTARVIFYIFFTFFKQKAYWNRNNVLFVLWWFWKKILKTITNFKVLTLLRTNVSKGEVLKYFFQWHIFVERWRCHFIKKMLIFQPCSLFSCVYSQLSSHDKSFQRISRNTYIINTCLKYSFHLLFVLI